MKAYLSIIPSILSILFLLPSFFIFLQVIAGFNSGKVKAVNKIQESLTPNRSTVVLMPAHNEATGIAVSINSVLRQLRTGDRLLVVADNCTDGTGIVAKACGAEVIERHDALRRGKGYALDYGIKWLAQTPPDVVIVIDADCIAQPGSVQQLTAACLASRRPIQALNLMIAPPGSTLSVRIAEFAWRIKNGMRPLGGRALGWPCPLMGTGMAFPWEIIESAQLATGNLVEDMQLGIDLTKAGTPPLFCPEALVTSSFPTDAAGVKSQRTRWEQGHLSILFTVGPPMIWHALKTHNSALLAMAFDVSVPPLSAFVLMLLGLTIFNIAWLWATGISFPLIVSLLSAGLFGVVVTAAWIREGRQIISLRELLTLPWYAIAKIPMYIGMLTKRQVEWVRAKRG
jgi:cellulose synthase/poly-beta-1,6-N-acetylglucosamine synthase-like glycosyltransferase